MTLLLVLLLLLLPLSTYPQNVEMGARNVARVSSSRSCAQMSVAIACSLISALTPLSATTESCPLFRHFPPPQCLIQTSLILGSLTLCLSLTQTGNVDATEFALVPDGGPQSVAADSEQSPLENGPYRRKLRSPQQNLSVP